MASSQVLRTQAEQVTPVSSTVSTLAARRKPASQVPWNALARFLTMTCSPAKRRDPLVDRDRFAPRLAAPRSGIFRCQRPESECGPAHHVVGGGRGKTIGIRLARAAFEQLLHRGDDGVHAVAGEGVSGAGPGVGEIDVDEGGAGAVADPALEPPPRVDLGIRREERLESGFHVVIHENPPDSATPEVDGGRCGTTWQAALSSRTASWAPRRFGVFE